MQRSPIPRIPLDPFLGKTPRTDCAAFNERIDAHEQAWAEYEAQRKNFLDAETGDVLADDAAELQKEHLRLLAMDVELREQLQAMCAKYRAEATKARDEALARQRKTEADIRKQLLTMGYTEGKGRGPCDITPDMIGRHPDVRAARAQARAIDNARRVGGPDLEMAQDMKAAKDRLQSARRRLVTV